MADESPPEKTPSREKSVRSHETRLRVRYAETDRMGVVYYANYLVWMELGRVEYCRAAGVRYRDMEADDGILLAVVEAHCRYLQPGSRRRTAAWPPFDMTFATHRTAAPWPRAKPDIYS